MKSRVKETAIGAACCSWLQCLGWDVFTEVSGIGGRADIVARQGARTWVVSCKVAWSFDAVEQAERWAGHANLISLCCSPTKLTSLKTRLFLWCGVGLLFASGDGVREMLEPRLNRRVTPNLAKTLQIPELAAWGAEAGNNRHDYWSPYRVTCREVLERVQKNPGIKTRELVDGLRHHYRKTATARSSLRHWVVAGKIPGVTFDGDQWWPK